MTDEQKCICDLHALLDEVSSRAEDDDFSLVRKGNANATGMRVEFPPICEILSKLTVKHRDVIRAALIAKKKYTVRSKRGAK